MLARIEAGAPVNVLAHGVGQNIDLFEGIAPWREFEIIQAPDADPVDVNDLYEFLELNDAELIQYMGGNQEALMAADTLPVVDGSNTEEGIEIQVLPENFPPFMSNRPAATLADLDVDIPNGLEVDYKIGIEDPNAPLDAPLEERIEREVNVREAVMPGMLRIQRASKWDGDETVAVLKTLPFFRQHAEDLVYVRMLGPTLPITLGIKIYDNQGNSILNLGQGGLEWNEDEGSFYYERMLESDSSRLVVFEHRFYLQPFKGFQSDLSVVFASPAEVDEARDRLLGLGYAFEICLSIDTIESSFASGVEKMVIKNYLIDPELQEEVPIEFLDNFELRSFDVVHRFGMDQSAPPMSLMIDLDRAEIVTDPCSPNFNEEWTRPNFDWRTELERHR
jgi:hypothetical protein